MQEQLRALIEQHCVSLRRILSEVENCLAPEAGGGPGEANLDRALGLVHQIKGSSGSIGFGEVSQSAAMLEAQLKRLRDGEFEEAGDFSRDLSSSFDGLRNLVAGLTPRQSTLFDADLGHLAAQN